MKATFIVSKARETCQEQSLRRYQLLVSLTRTHSLGICSLPFTPISQLSQTVKLNSTNGMRHSRQAFLVACDASPVLVLVHCFCRKETDLCICFCFICVFLYMTPRLFFSHSRDNSTLNQES